MPASHPRVEFGKIGVLLINLGSPSGADYWSVRRYLKQFLSDKRVIELNRLLWYFILNGIILMSRPFATGRLYRSIWNNKKKEAPLITTTRATAEKLERQMQKLYHNDAICFSWAMRYGKPAIADRIHELKKIGCDRLLIMPLYPQYCASTTASVMDDCFDTLKKIRWIPAIRSLPPYYDNSLYIDALAQSVENSLQNIDFIPQKLVISFHGIPLEYFQKGDPYHCHCQKTGRLLGEKIGWQKENVVISFQSRFGSKPWLQPYTDKTVAKLAKDGIRKIIVIAPGFSADCLETIEEINGEIKEAFEQNGGENFAYIDCLNDSELAIELYSALTKNELAGWLDNGN